MDDFVFLTFYMKESFMQTQPTQIQYISLQQAFDFFNNRLFEDTLPPVFITFQRQKKGYGYYWSEKLESRKDKTKIAEIALNIASFHKRRDIDIFSTLVHEMVHHWQFCYGHPSRTGYHNMEWAVQMQKIGLMPSNTGLPEGKITGQHMTHYTMEGGYFDLACKELIHSGISIDWQSSEEGKAKKPAINKTKYTCLNCDYNVWGKAGLLFSCEECGELYQEKGK